MRSAVWRQLRADQKPEGRALDQFRAFPGRGGPDDGDVFRLDGVEALQDGLGRGAAAVAALLDLADDSRRASNYPRHRSSVIFLTGR